MVHLCNNLIGMIKKFLNKKFRFFLLIILIISTISVVSAKKVYAKEEFDTVLVDIAADLSGSVRYSILLTNEEENFLIDSYQIHLPFLDVTAINASLNNIPINSKINDGILTLTLEGNAIYPKSSGRLNIELTGKEIIKNLNNIKFLRLNKIKTNQIIKYKVKVPNSFGTISFLTAKQEKEEKVSGATEITFATEGGIFIAWGNRSNVKLDYSITSTGGGFFNLVPSSNLQEVDYLSLSGLLYGLGDLYGNIWGAKNPLEDEVKFSLLVKTGQTQFVKEIPDYSKIFYEFSDKNDQLDSSMVNLSNNERIKKINDFVKTISYNEEYPGLTLCKAAGAIAQKNNFRSVIKYGYLIFAELSFKPQGSLHIWCEVETPEKIITLDPYLEKETGYQFFDNNGYDRITLGVFDPNSSFILPETINNLTKIKTAEITFNSVMPEVSRQNTTLEFYQTDNAFMLAIGELAINSLESIPLEILKMNLVVFDNFKLDRNLQQYQVIVLPQTKNKIPVIFKKQLQNLFSLEESFPVEMQLATKTIFGNINVKWEISYIYIAAALIILVPMIFYLGIKIFKTRKKFIFLVKKSTGFRIK